MAQNSYESAKEDALGLLGGAAIYGVLQWILYFYPAFIIGMCICRMIYGVVPDTGAYDGDRSCFFFLCLGIMVVMTIVIYVLVKFRQWFILLMIYALTLWPFLCVIGHYSGPSEGIPIPLDFWPFW